MLTSLPSRGAWIEIFRFAVILAQIGQSLPSRGAWIEIHLTVLSTALKCVAPLAGSVDRNGKGIYIDAAGGVAPLAGSVDRNQAADEGQKPAVRRSPRGERG